MPVTPITPGTDMSTAPDGLPMGPDPSAASVMPNLQPAQMVPVGHMQTHPAYRGEESVSAQQTPVADEELAVDPSLEDDPDDEHLSKRQRLDVPPDSSMEDEAVMNALAAHTNPDSAESYEEE